ncbi:MAG: hypothetical protein V1493_06545 [Candidatus Diapherotrites archaeon]
MAGGAKPRRIRQALDVLRVKRLTGQDMEKMDAAAKSKEIGVSGAPLGFGWKGRANEAPLHGTARYVAAKGIRTRHFDASGTMRRDYDSKHDRRYDEEGRRRKRPKKERPETIYDRKPVGGMGSHNTG